MSTVTKSITAKDLNAKFTSGESTDNKLRKAWVLQLPEEQKQKLKSIPNPPENPVRTQLYKSIDAEVSEIYAMNLKIAREKAIAEGVEYERVDGIKRLKKIEIDSDDVLIESAVQWINKFIQENH